MQQGRNIEVFRRGRGQKMIDEGVMISGVDRAVVVQIVSVLRVFASGFDKLRGRLEGFRADGQQSVFRNPVLAEMKGVVPLAENGAASRRLYTLSASLMSGSISSQFSRSQSLPLFPAPYMRPRIHAAAASSGRSRRKSQFARICRYRVQ